MKNGDFTDFLDQLYYGGELVFEYAGSKYFIQGWTEKDQSVMVLDHVCKDEFKQYLWTHEARTMKECAEAFLTAPLWNSKTFPEIQEDVTWSDW